MIKEKGKSDPMTADKDTDKEQAMAALQNILNFKRRLPQDFDEDKELVEARDEKYGNLG